MKIFPSLLVLFCSSLSCFSLAEEADTNSGGEPITAAAPLSLDTFDYFGFAAMEKCLTGRALRELTFSRLEKADGIASLLKILNQKYDMGVPASVSQAVIAKFSLPQGGNFNTAEFEFSGTPSASGNISDTFFKKLIQEEKHVSTAGTLPENTFLLPDEITQKLPPVFLENAKSVLAKSSGADALTVITSSEPVAEIPDFRENEGYIAACADASRPDVLIYRKFARRAVDVSGFSLSFPSGDFFISERDNRTLIFVDFHCDEAQEAVFLEHFFLRFKMNLIDSAKLQPQETCERLITVGESLTISRSGKIVKIRIDCPAEDFPAFLTWRASIEAP